MARLPVISPTVTLGYLIKSHYLGDDIPSVVTTANFSDWCVKNYATLETVKALLGRTTACGTFTAPWKDTRRVISIPHPTSQLALSIIINNNLAAIRAEIAGAKLSLYDTTTDRGAERVFRGLDFEKVMPREARALAHANSIMTADIGNFFHTIYSHSVPWAVLGKSLAKLARLGNPNDPDPAVAQAVQQAKTTFNGHWSADVDNALQACNRRETFGIPVGPDTSRIVAELLLAGVQKDQMLSSLLNGKDGYRLMDDFFVGFDGDEDARRCLNALRAALWEFNLYLNDRKTKVIGSADVQDNIWKYEIENFPLLANNQKVQRQQMQRLVEITVGHCRRLDDSRPAASFCKRVMDMKIMAINLGYVLDCLLRIAREYPANTKTVARFVMEYRNPLRKPATRDVLDRWTIEMLGAHGPQGNDLEICWSLMIRGVMQLDIDLGMLGNATNFSPVTLCIAGLLHQHGLLLDTWMAWDATSEITGGLANGRHWLPNYEAVLRKWTTDTTLVAEINADPLFKRLLRARVTFLDDLDLAGNDADPDDTVWSARELLQILRRAPVRAGRAMRNDPYG